jgi:hypothetical protein
MSPGGRRGRALATTDESHLRDLSPHTTLQAFTQRPMPYDTGRDEYKIFACIETLTPAERDLGTRVAKAAQRLKSWCDEIQQWGWSGSFEPPSEEYRELRRQSLELRIREHVKDPGNAEKLPPLEYWGSILSVEVRSHEARLDDMSDELIALDIEELKGHVLDMHPGSRSRPSSAGYGAERPNYTPLDDFNFLITQTLLSALPHHFQLKERLSAWTARVTVLREAPRYLDDLKTTQRAIRMGWQALASLEDTSDAAIGTWKNTLDTASGVLRDRVGDLGRRLDQLLDTLEGREDCLPDKWIDSFESIEAEFGRWAHDSRRKMMEVDLWRDSENKATEVRDQHHPSRPDVHSEAVTTSAIDQSVEAPPHARPVETEPRSFTAFETKVSHLSEAQNSTYDDDHDNGHKPSNVVDDHEPNNIVDDYEPSNIVDDQKVEFQPDSPTGESPDGSTFEEGDTVIHNETEDTLSDDAQPQLDSDAHSEFPTIDVTAEQEDVALKLPQTPRLRRDSIESITSSMSFSSSPPGVDESPSVRNATNQNARQPRPALNAAMTKRRPVKSLNDIAADSTPPWPPSQFAQKPTTSAEDLERKISDILTTIPTHIRLTSETGADVRNRKSARGVTNKGSKGFLRAEPSLGRMKSPELTLSPVKHDHNSANGVSGRRSAVANGDNDIKLYHLTQAGKEQPLKLSIRRVGKNGERVMVRVGGGWADLGEYLRQYAEHHGRRTASNGEFELMGLEVKHTDFSPNRPESVMSKRDRRVSGGVRSGSPNVTPIKSTGVVSTDEAPPPQPNFTTTPSGSLETTSPSTGSSRASWQGNEVGLAGPTTKRIDLSDKKLEWIEGMMKQARTVSGTLVPQSTNQNTRAESRGESRGESRSESRTAARRPQQDAKKTQTDVKKAQPDLRKQQSDFGDLGKVGGTKRIFLRGGVLGEH